MIVETSWVDNCQYTGECGWPRLGTCDRMLTTGGSHWSIRHGFLQNWIVLELLESGGAGVDTEARAVSDVQDGPSAFADKRCWLAMDLTTGRFPASKMDGLAPSKPVAVASRRLVSVDVATAGENLNVEAYRDTRCPSD